MNWIRDNILKLLILLGISIVVIVIVVACSKRESLPQVESASGYVELENRLQTAAVKFINKNKNLLPKSEEKTRKINLDTLVQNNYVKEMHALEDSKVVCSGYVEISMKKKNSYRYTPYLKCGKYYETKVISQYIIDNTELATSRDGLYKYNNEYYYKGEAPNNYIKLDEDLFRILSITEEGNLKLIATRRTASRHIWDDRFNSEANKYYGINNFELSRLKDSLTTLYNNEDENNGEVYFTDAQKELIVEHSFCIGKRKENDTKLYSDSECKETTNLKVGLINLNDYYRISTSSSCTGIDKLECNNYNYLFSYNYNTFVTLTGDEDSSYSFYSINDGKVTITRTSRGYKVYPVVYIDSNLIYKSGTGTLEDPYVIR